MIVTNLAKQYSPYLKEYSDALERFICSGVYINGEIVSSFETAVSRYLGAEHAAGCGNGTHALQLGLMACGVRPGDEVITVANTYYATVRAIVEVGAVPVFCDVNDSGLIDVSKLESLITPRTKAILPVHLYGMAADLTALRALCKKHKLALVEDCSHAFGSTYNGRRIGADSYCACFSLYPTKNLGAMGDAGVVVGAEKIIQRIKRMRYYSSRPTHDRFSLMSLHSRLDPIQAGLLCVSLSHIEEWNASRIANARFYEQAFQGRVKFFPPLVSDGTVPYVFPIRVRRRNDFISYMKGREIATQVHFGVNLHRLAHLAKSDVKLPMTERLNREVVSLPVSPTITKDEIRYIAETALGYFK